LTFTNLTVSFTDASTDDNVGGPATVYVNWGDGSPVATCGVIGSVCTKTYAAAGTYNITHYVKDAGGLLSGNDTFQAIVPAKFFVNVTTSAATQSALVQIKLGTMIKAQGYTSAAGTWTSLVKLPVGAYTATITKSGKTFDCDGAGLANNPVPVNITNADVTINCTVTP
jgi:PKD repeat protein